MRQLLLLILMSFSLAANANSPEMATPAPGQIVVTGTVPDEASKAGLLAQLRNVYGADKVVDQISIGRVVLPANWNEYVKKIISPNLKSISHGVLKIDGYAVNIKGEVANEATKQKVASNIATSLDASFTIQNALSVSSSDQQALDSTLDNRTIEFNLSNAILTAKGQAILAELVPPLLALKNKKIEIIGHTDNTGLRSSNLALSKARAYAVKDYLAGAGVDSSIISASGVGFDSPIASNETVEGRAKNRRIEFRVVE